MSTFQLAYADVVVFAPAAYGSTTTETLTASRDEASLGPLHAVVADTVIVDYDAPVEHIIAQCPFSSKNGNINQSNFMIVKKSGVHEVPVTIYEVQFDVVDQSLRNEFAAQALEPADIYATLAFLRSHRDIVTGDHPLFSLERCVKIVDRGFPVAWQNPEGSLILKLSFFDKVWHKGFRFAAVPKAP